jgi:hypothetical protein
LYADTSILEDHAVSIFMAEECRVTGWNIQVCGNEGWSLKPITGGKGKGKKVKISLLQAMEAHRVARG